MTSRLRFLCDGAGGVWVKCYFSPLSSTASALLAPLKAYPGASAHLLRPYSEQYRQNHHRLATTVQLLTKKRLVFLSFERPNSPIPFVAVIGSSDENRRHIRVTTMAGSFAFPLLYVDDYATIASGIFTNDAHRQTPGIFWVSRSSRSIYRQLLMKDAVTTELFEVPKGYSLLKPRGVIRTRR